MGGPIERHVRLSTRRHLRNAAILFALALVAYALTAGPIATVLGGVAPLDRAALLAGRPQTGFVRVALEAPLIRTGVRQSTVIRTRNSSRTVVEHFFALPVGDRYLIVQTDQPDILGELTGELVPADQENDRTRIIPDMERAVPALRGKLLPAKLFISLAPPFGWFAVAAVVALAGFGLWQLVLFAARASDPLRHPLMRGLARYGDARQIASAIDVASPPGENTWPIWTPRWLVTAQDAVPFKEVVWAHPNTVRGRGIVMHSGRLYDRSGHVVTVPLGGKVEAIDAFMRRVQQHAPWATLGYTQELEKLWRANRAEFLAEVDLRRQATGDESAGG